MYIVPTRKIEALLAEKDLRHVFGPSKWGLFGPSDTANIGRFFKTRVLQLGIKFCAQ
jgi:hypothetical protein